MNIRLLPGSLLVQQKYKASRLKSSDTAGAPYPLAKGDMPYDYEMQVPVTLKGKTDLMFFPEATVSISRERKIVATPVINGKGTVKEMITEGDLNLTLAVSIVSTDMEGNYDGYSHYSYDRYPFKGVERLRRLLDEPNRLDVVSDFLTLFDLDGDDFGIIVKSYSMKQDTHLNVQKVEIEALSDYDYDLLIKE